MYLSCHQDGTTTWTQRVPGWELPRLWCAPASPVLALHSGPTCLPLTAYDDTHRNPQGSALSVCRDAPKHPGPGIPINPLDRAASPLHTVKLTAPLLLLDVQASTNRYFPHFLFGSKVIPKKQSLTCFWFFDWEMYWLWTHKIFAALYTPLLLTQDHWKSHLRKKWKISGGAGVKQTQGRSAHYMLVKCYSFIY